ncbi:hypothetical protein FACS189485_23030 [Spirochaetia bacterium]|nr:hypothetical protein FACS189485_23030 [Spirochaetia bacterium]
MTEKEKIAHVTQQLGKLDREGKAYIKTLSAALVSLPALDDTAQSKTSMRCGEYKGDLR